jgi:3-carboxy-cis,cis-muconate cycloisomerase
MTFSPSDSKIYAPLFSEPQIAEIFSDEQFVRYLLTVEAALAKAQSQLDMIPTAAAAKIIAEANELSVDFDALQTGVEQAGVLIVELIQQFRAQVGTEAADYVHWGATTQDIVDTALVLQLRAALAVIEPTLLDVIRSSVAPPAAFGRDQTAFVGGAVWRCGRYVGCIG